MDIKLSVITVVYNASDLIMGTINSVLCQTYQNIEYIIVDGASTDGTVEIIKKFANTDSRIKFVSEKDNGIYDAMNKGIKIATGDWVIFINSGDELFDANVIEKACLASYNDFDIVYGNCLKVFNTFTRFQVAGDYKKILFTPIFWHQAVFVKTSLLKANPFDLRYRIAADWNFFVRMNSCGKKFQKIDLCVARVLAEGFSSNNVFPSFFERWKIAREINSSIIVNLLYLLKFIDLMSRESIKKIIPKRIVSFIIAHKKSSV